MKTNTVKASAWLMQFKYYHVFLALSVGIPFLSNLAATKPVQFGPPVMFGPLPILPLPLDGGFLLFPLAYVFDDIITEVYGYAGARRSIYISAIVTTVATLYLWLVAWALPILSGNQSYQDAFGLLFSSLPVLVFGSIVSFMIGSFVNAFIVANRKRQDEGRRMKWRLFKSTLVGEAMDTLVFASFFELLFHLSWWQWIQYVVFGYVWKVLVEAILLFAVTARLINWIKAKEGVDVYDYGESLNPVPFVGPAATWVVAKLRHNPCVSHGLCSRSCIIVVLFNEFDTHDTKTTLPAGPFASLRSVRQAKIQFLRYNFVSIRSN